MEYAIEGEFTSFEKEFGDSTAHFPKRVKSSARNQPSLAPLFTALSSADKRLVDWLNQLRQATGHGMTIPKLTRLPPAQDRRVTQMLLSALRLRKWNAVDYPKFAQSFRCLGDEAIHQLGMQLEAKGPLVQFNAVNTLGHVGRVNAFTLARLQRLADSNDVDVRQAAKTALAKLQPAPEHESKRSRSQGPVRKKRRRRN
jgi:hypothetical protein